MRKPGEKTFDCSSAAYSEVQQAIGQGYQSILFGSETNSRSQDIFHVTKRK
jgi:hypothetical protein